MGQEILKQSYDTADYQRFAETVRRETDELAGWMAAGRFEDAPTSIGYELEACLINSALQPADANSSFLRQLGMPEVVPELARCNVEFNGNPYLLSPGGLHAMHDELNLWLRRSREVADSLGLRLVLIGILPTLTEGGLGIDHISDSNRYRAIDRSIARLRGTDYVDIRIDGRTEDYRGRFDSIMAESAATSFQLHTRLPVQGAQHWFNAALAISGPLLAIAANSPYLFGKDLWAETRIPVFAQSVDTGRAHYVTFGSDYLRESVLELFEINASRYAPLLPEELDSRGLRHLVLHNGTIWRWNRPILDCADPERPHFRLEHRSLPSGPSVPDMVANAALLFGLLQQLGQRSDIPALLPFSAARRNFYRAARFGMDAELAWLDGRSVSAKQLWEVELFDLAAEGLKAAGIQDASHYLDIARRRVQRGLSGAGWQRAWMNRNGGDLTGLLGAYLPLQESGAPVCEWPLE